MITECCGVEVLAEHRFCPKCGWEFRATHRPAASRPPEEKFIQIDHEKADATAIADRLTSMRTSSDEDLRTLLADAAEMLYDWPDADPAASRSPLEAKIEGAMQFAADEFKRTGRVQDDDEATPEHADRLKQAIAAASRPPDAQGDYLRGYATALIDSIAAIEYARSQQEPDDAANDGMNAAVFVIRQMKPPPAAGVLPVEAPPHERKL